MHEHEIQEAKWGDKLTFSFQKYKINYLNILISRTIFLKGDERPIITY